MHRAIFLAAALSVAAIPFASAAAGCRTGSVFEDVDFDGVRGPRERGLASVQVSDGRQLVRTDADLSLIHI